ncbi:MAG: hypothetical protein AAF658_16085, partial [Myxococcota bacterium]
PRAIDTPKYTSMGNHNRRAEWAGCVFFFASLLGSDANATTVREASLSELVSLSAWVVDARVREVVPGSRAFTTTYHLELDQVLKGNASTQTLSFTVPGGRSGSHELRIPGVPRLEREQRVVLLLESTPDGGLIFTGLGQGVFSVDGGFAHRAPIHLESPLGGDDGHAHEPQIVRHRIADLLAELRLLAELQR